MRVIRLTAVRAEPRDDAEQLTQVFGGDYVEAREAGDGWMRVTVPGQPTSKDPAGYPGWVRTEDLAFDEEALLAIARGYLGTPYVWGGLTHDGIDCSGLVFMSFGALGVQVPRDSPDQAAACERVPLGEERPGDLWFFTRDGADGRVTHVGFVTEPGVMLHAPDSGPRRYVVEEPMPEERKPVLLFAGRFPPQ